MRTVVCFALAVALAPLSPANADDRERRIRKENKKHQADRNKAQQDARRAAGVKQRNSGGSSSGSSAGIDNRPGAWHRYRAPVYDPQACRKHESLYECKQRQNPNRGRSSYRRPAKKISKAEQRRIEEQRVKEHNRRRALERQRKQERARSNLTAYENKLRRERATRAAGLRTTPARPTTRKGKWNGRTTVIPNQLQRIKAFRTPKGGIEVVCYVWTVEDHHPSWEVAGRFNQKTRIQFQPCKPQTLATGGDTGKPHPTLKPARIRRGTEPSLVYDKPNWNAWPDWPQKVEWSSPNQKILPAALAVVHHPNGMVLLQAF